ncbi:MAG: hypothetical protein KAS85_04740 [Rhodobacteraceae bacterium]|nr:hypothetical protein [Paracoccaceae bacterium]
MKNLLTAVTTVAIVSSASYALAQNQLETTLDLVVRGMMDDGAEISYDERIVGADGSVEYIDLVIAAPEGEFTMSMDWLKGVPSGSDVTFTVSDTIDVSGREEGVEFSFEIQSAAFKLTTNGVLREAMSAEDVTVTFSADAFIVDGGDPDSDVLRKVFVDLGAIDFDLLVSTEEMFVKGAFDAEKMDVAYDYTIDGQSQEVEQTTEATAVSFEFDIPADEEDALGYLDGSKSGVIEMTSGASEFVMTMDADGIALDMEGTSGDSSALLEIVDGTITYDVNADGFDMVVTPGAGMPIPPVEVGMGEIAMKLIIPAGAADTPAEMVVDILFADLVVGEGLWSMIDPGKTISRDPAQLDIDIEALVQLDAMAAVAGEDPASAAKIHNLDINQILLSLAGASIQMDGAATFDNSGPIPMPLGSLNIDMRGISTLANQLVALGLLDQMQAGMAMGMMMAFGQPGDEADQFISEITFSENGIMANGQPIQ